MQWRPTLDAVGLASAFGGWSAIFLAQVAQPLLWVLPAGFAVGGLCAARYPLAGAAVVGCTQALGLLLGAPAENAAGLLPALACLYLTGRRVAPWPGLAVLAAFIAVIAGTGLEAVRAVIGMLLFTGTWLVGRVAAEGATQVQARRTIAQDLEERDHASLTAAVVERERTLILANSLRVVGDAVRAMHADTARAAATLDRDLLERVGTRGETAVADLRRVLGLLRSPAAPAETRREAGPGHAARDEPDAGASRLRSSDALLGVALALLGLGEAMLADASTLALALAVLIPLTLAARRAAPVTATLACAVPLALAWVLDVALPHGGSEMATLALLAWTVGSLRDRQGAATALAPAALVLTVTLSALSHTSLTLSVIPFCVGILAYGAALAGTVRRRTHHQIDRRIRDAQTQLQASLDHAVASERLRIARELHDITSHAVGAMVLQARAAAVLAGRNPDRARSAIDNALHAGEQALTELTHLDAMLDDAPLALGSGELVAVAERLAGTGLRISITGELPADPEVATTAHRIVQEALTNAARHAPGAAVTVTLSHDEDRLRIRIEDSGATRAGPTAAGSGFGLAGLSERVRLHGGRLRAGPHGGGFLVEAAIPLPAATPPAEVPPTQPA
ncbi:ATP-binding protein [Nocardioides sp. L-11A]|uniref:ATP-binding protein n=1 Tax=Nocardioides sp. L-11A TaxID=3043848 RepID=UPI00249AFEE9|nr:histidine kinase [Nocardioides sp. L-11A]